MEEWKTYKLGEVCSRLKSGKGINSELISQNGTYPVIGGNGIRGYTGESNFKGQCGVIGRQGAYCGNVRFYSGEAYMTEHAIVVVGNEIADTYFLTCVLSLMHLGNLSGQSAQPGLSVQALAKQEIKLPDIQYQKKVRKILSSIDNKIELNRRINDNLEAMANQIYNHWFVQYEFPNSDGNPYKSSGGELVWNDNLNRDIPSDWHESTLGQFLTINYGRDHRLIPDGEIPVYGSGGKIRNVNEALYNGESILIPRKGTLNNIMYVNEAFWTVDTMFYTILNIPYCAKYVYYSIKDIDFMGLNVGTSIPSMTASILYSIKIPMPPIGLLHLFETKITEIFSMKYSLKTENEILVQQRNELLPRLIKGII